MKAKQVKNPRNPAFPDPPEALSDAAKARWRTVAQILAGRDQTVDVDQLSTYCELWARWQQAEQSITKSGSLVRTARGGIAASPLLTVSNRTAAQVRGLEKALRLDVATPSRPDPSARAKRRGNRLPDLLTRRRLAAAIGVHMMTVTKWEQDGMPVAHRGGKGRPSHYREVDVRAWIQQREEAAKQPGAVNLVQERARKERAQAIRAETETKIRLRQLVESEDIVRLWAAEAAAARAIILSHYTTHADRVYRAATLEGLPGVEAALREMVLGVLRELSDPDRPPGLTQPSPEPAAAA